MPKYRKLHVKTTESLDINDMPDDFTRLLWVLLPLGLCREGRGLDNQTWIKSKIFPLREDISNGMISDAFDWYESRGMLIRYEVDKRNYFFLPAFHDYQGVTLREKESDYPPPLKPSQELVKSKSRTTQTNKNKDGSGYVLNTASESESESTSESSKNKVVPFSELISEQFSIPDFIETWHEWVDYRKEIRKTMKKTTASRQLKMLSKYDVATAIKMLDRSMTNGWTGIFELDRKVKGKPTSTDAVEEYKRERGY